MLDRKKALAGIAKGDLFHAHAPNGASLVCVTDAVTGTTIVARHVTSQHRYAFDRTTGTADQEVRGEIVSCTIGSVARLPAHIRDALLGLDRIYANTSRTEDHRLTESERRALVFATRYYPLHPLPQPEPSWEMMSVGRTAGPPGDPEDYDALSGDEKVELILANFLIPANRPR